MPKNRFFRHISGFFGREILFLKIEFQHILGIAILHLCAKNKKKTNEPIPQKAENRKMVKGNFPKKRKSVFCDEKKFSGKNCFGHILWYLALYLSAKNQKKLMKQFCTKSKKPYFQAVFGPNLPQIFFFENRSPSHFRDCHFTPLCQKSEKTNEPIPRKAENRKMIKGNFPKKQKSVFLRRTRFFPEKPLVPHFNIDGPLTSCKKLEKFHERISRKVQKIILGKFGQKYAE